MNIQLSSVQCFWFLGLLSANPMSGNTLKICHYVTYYLRQNRKCKNQHYWGALSEAYRNTNYSCIWVIFLPFLISLWPTPLPDLDPHLSLRRQWSYWQGNQSVSIQSTVHLSTLMVRINPLISRFWLNFLFFFSLLPFLYKICSGVLTDLHGFSRIYQFPFYLQANLDVFSISCII